jgi:hypothetical protein
LELKGPIWWSDAPRRNLQRGVQPLDLEAAVSLFGLPDVDDPPADSRWARDVGYQARYRAADRLAVLIDPELYRLTVGREDGLLNSTRSGWRKCS